MVEAVWLVTRENDPGDSHRDGIKAVVINADDASTVAQVIADAVGMVNGLFPSDDGDKLPAGYFDAAVEIGDLTAGPIRTDLDGYVFGTIKGSVLT